MEPIFQIYCDGVLVAELSEYDYSMKSAISYAKSNFQGRIDVVPYLQ